MLYGTYKPYAFKGTTIEEVLVEVYNLVTDYTDKITDAILTVEEVKKYIQSDLVPSDVNEAINEMYANGKLGELINGTLLSDINNKVHTLESNFELFKTDINNQFKTLSDELKAETLGRIEEAEKRIETLNTQLYNVEVSLEATKTLLENVRTQSNNNLNSINHLGMIKDKTNYKLETMTEKKGQIIAHRNYSKCFPENSMFGFTYCVDDSKTDGIEIDVHMTTDNVPVVMHDDNMSRTSSLSNTITSSSWSSISNAQIGKEFYSSTSTSIFIKSVDAFLDSLKDKKLFIELKNGFNSQARVNLICQKIIDRGLTNQVYLIMFSDSIYTSYIKDKFNQIKILFLCSNNNDYERQKGIITENINKYGRQLNTLGMSISKDILDGGKAYTLNCLSIAWGVWTITSYKEYEKIKKYNPTFVTTDVFLK